MTLFSSIRLACVKLLCLLHSFNIFVMAPLKKPRTFIPSASFFYFSGCFCCLLLISNSGEKHRYFHSNCPPLCLIALSPLSCQTIQIQFSSSYGINWHVLSQSVCGNCCIYRSSINGQFYVSKVLYNSTSYPGFMNAVIGNCKLLHDMKQKGSQTFGSIWLRYRYVIMPVWQASVYGISGSFALDKLRTKFTWYARQRVPKR